MIAGCAGPIFGPGGFDQVKLEGRISPEIADQFHQMDSDGDGLLDSSEIQTSSFRQGITLPEADSNRDGRVSESEYAEYIRDNR